MSKKKHRKKQRVVANSDANQTALEHIREKARRREAAAERLRKLIEASTKTNEDKEEAVPDAEGDEQVTSNTD